MTQSAKQQEQGTGKYMRLMAKVDGGIIEI